MDRKETIVQRLKQFKRTISSQFSVEKMIFFGSMATGKHRKESDIDLIIVSPSFEGKRFRERPLGLYKYWRLNTPFDFLCYTPQEFKKRRKQITILREAVRTGIAI